MSRYRLSGKRSGTAILRFTQTPFSLSGQRSVPGTVPAGSDIVQALRVNLILQFDDGGDPVSEQISAFTNSSKEGVALKVTRSRHERAGPFWRELLFFPDGVQEVSHNEATGEGDSRQMLPARVDGIPEEVIPLVARRLAWPKLRLGQRYSLDILTDQKWSSAEAELSSGRETVHTSAGWFRVNRFTVYRASGQTQTWWVEAEEPHRIVRWTTGAGVSAELLKQQ